ADLPVKAKPVEYVKVCSLYGAGFYYVPGTDICMKVGSYIRFQQDFGQGSSISAGGLAGAGGRSTRVDTQDYAMRTRAVATFDTRQQTAYGTLRTYLLMGFQQDSTLAPSTSPNVYMTRGFIQLAGFTFGKATSFFDFVSTAAVAYNAGFNYAPDTGDAGQMVAAYTAQFGNGLSATISAEQSRRLATVGVLGTSFGSSLGNPVGLDMGGIGFTQANGDPVPPTRASSAAGVGLADIVGNIRIDQAWGSAQISAALHDARAGYYANGSTAASNVWDVNGHPDDKWGWAVSAGLRLNAPMIGPGDYFQAQAIYTQGAIRYAAQTPSGSTLQKWNGNDVGFGFWEDGIFGNGNVELTTAWSLFASYEHFWTPSLRTSLYGSYIDVSHNGAATAIICTSGGAFTANDPGCNPDWSAWNIGARSQWDITKDLYVGLDVIYQKLNSASPNSAGVLNVTGSGAGANAPGQYLVRDQDAWTATWRIQRSITP
ncbi:MAG: porin, partial [Rhizobiales bacterium]|nr:porin [Hyphomicrobiales bacterium]